MPAIESLRKRSYARVPLPPDDASRTVESLGIISSHLARERQVPRLEVTGSRLALKSFAERSQLRYTPNSTSDDTVNSLQLERAAAESCASLAEIASSALVTLNAAVGTPNDGIRLLDAFFYPGSAQWNAHDSRSPPSPCPAHEDPGLITVIIEDGPALE
eukprot:3562581-Prymnesium_polylepis.1